MALPDIASTIYDPSKLPGERTMRTSARTLIAALLALPLAAQAQIQSETIAYKDGDTQLQGFLYYDDAISGKRPGVIVVHEWWGLNDYAKHRAEMLAKLGYAAFALDMYGDQKVTTHAKDAQGWSAQITANTDAWRRRALAGLEVLKADPHVDAQHLAAVGYCFGGSTVMQMAYSGADLDAVVSFHGSLPTPAPGEGEKIKASILAAHGDADAFVPPEKVEAFKAALEAAKADWEFVSYGGARHAFTNPNAASYGIDNIRYDERADKRSWQTMQAFLKEAFAR
jgi:dienelactone hydrolase